MNSPLAARGSQEVGITQPKANFLSDPCREAPYLNLKPKIKTVLIFRSLIPPKNVNNEDVPTSAEQSEESAFLDAVMDSAIMREAYDFLSQTSKCDR